MGEKDITHKTLESYNDVFADIVNGLLFQGRQIISEDDLEDYTPYGYYKAANKVRSQERDIAKRWEKGGVCISCLGIENQDSIDLDMPIRVMAYDAAVYRNQLGKNAPDRRYPVLSLVVYLGYKEPWNGPLRLKGRLDISAELDRFISDYNINVFPIAWLTREQVREWFHGDFRVVADYYVQRREKGNYVPDMQTLRHAREVVQLLSVMEHDDRFETAYNTMLEEDPSKEGGCNMCEVIDRFVNMGKAEGIEQGLEQGAEQERARNVLALVEAGHADQSIAEWLHLDIRYVQDIRLNKAR